MHIGLTFDPLQLLIDTCSVGRPDETPVEVYVGNTAAPMACLLGKSTLYIERRLA